MLAPGPRPKTRKRQSDKPWLNPARAYRDRRPTFWDCLRWMGWEGPDGEYIDAGGKTNRPLENHTRLVAGFKGSSDARPEAFAIVLHDTPVVTIRWGIYTLRSGGWHTMTTADRIRRYSPARLGSDRGRWYVGWDSTRVARIVGSAEDPTLDVLRYRVPFREGMRVNSDGVPVDVEDLARVETCVAGKRPRRRWIPGWGDSFGPTVAVYAE